MMKRKRWLPLLGTIYIVGVAAFLMGVYVAHARVWPFMLLRDIYRFVEGNIDESTSLFEKISNDLGVRPERFLFDYAPQAPDSFRTVDKLPLASRRIAPIIRTSGRAPKGYVYIVGKFDFADGMNGALLFDTRGKFLKRWVVPKREIERAEHHLFHLRRDGSVVAAPDYAPIYHLDRCSKGIGRIYGNFHHSIDRIDDERYWVSGSRSSRDAISVINIATHKIERTILLKDIHKAVDPELSIFELGVGRGEGDPWHNNDVEQLTEEDAKHSQFEVGDLVVSYRHANLIYVVDPDTLEIKWWSQAYSSGQHDPDWQPDGTITVFDNRALGKPGRFSTIQRYDFSDKKPKIILDGRKYGFFTSILGKHTVFEDGSILAVAYEQGRVLWVGPDGKIWFEFVNRYTEGEALAITNVGYLPPDYFTTEITAPCKQ